MGFRVAHGLQHSISMNDDNNNMDLGGKYHWATVADAGGTRLVWKQFSSLTAAKQELHRTLRLPALRNSSPVLHPAGKAKGHYFFG